MLRARVLLFIGLLPILAASIAVGDASPTAFTYQGQLKDGGAGVNAPSARIAFRLWDGETGGAQVGADVVVYPVQIVDGIFTSLIDFGDGAFNGNSRWLDIGVDLTGGTTYAWMSPRQPVTATPYAIHALHCDDAVWDLNGANIYFQGGNVGIGMTSPTYPLDVATSSSIRAISGVSTDPGTGRSGVFGQTYSTDGYGVRGNASAGTGTSSGVYGEGVSPTGFGVRGYAGATSGTPIGVQGSVRYNGGIGVKGLNTASTGNGIAVYGEASSSTGFGGYFLGRGYFRDYVGIGTDAPTSQLDVAGTVKATGFLLPTSPQAGYVLTSDALGNGTWQVAQGGGGGIGGSGTTNYIPKFTGGTTLGNSIIYETAAGNIGIGTAAPSQKLQVLGTIKMNGFQLPVSPQAGYVLTSDAAGIGTWQAATGGGGLTLPYNGSVTSSAAAFRVTNSGTGISSHGIAASIDNPNAHGDAAAGTFSTLGSQGYGVQAFSETGPCLYGYYSGTSGYAVSGSSAGVGGATFTCSKLGGHGIKAIASNMGTSATTRGGWFIANAPQGQAVRAEASGSLSSAVYATVSGSNTAAVYAESDQGVGIVAKGGDVSAAFYGNVEIYEYGTQNRVLSLGSGLDYAEGFNLSDDRDSGDETGPGTVLVIDPENPGQLARSRHAYDRKVAGIVAGANGLGSGVRLGSDQFDRDVALAGRVYCNVVTFDESIAPGDLLTTSSVPGRAMRVGDHAAATGAILGKAMEPLAANSTGQILVLVTLQ
jgi:hypothetical protein